MASRPGLKKVVKTVRGKRGTVRRSYWVKAKDVLRKHGGKILAGAAVAGAAYLGHKHGRSIAEHVRGRVQGFQKAHQAIAHPGQHLLASAKQSALSAAKAAPKAAGSVAGAGLRMAARGAGTAGKLTGRATLWGVKQVPGAARAAVRAAPAIGRGVRDFAKGFYHGVRGS